jgi:AcrR family transcriptional regulator
MQRHLDLKAAATVLAEHDGVTMSDVAARLGMAKPTLYRLAGSKAELLRACVDAEAERLLGHLHATFDDDDPLGGALRAMSAFAAESPGGFRLLFGRPGRDVGETISRLEQRVSERLRGRERPELLAAALLGAGAAVVARLNPPVQRSTDGTTPVADLPTKRWW